MNYSEVLSIPTAPAVCYSGYRSGQVPGVSYPSYEQVKEDLLIVKQHWTYIRLYSCDNHSKTVLEVIEKEQLDIKHEILEVKSEIKTINTNIKWIMAILLLIAGILLKNTFIH